MHTRFQQLGQPQRTLVTADILSRDCKILQRFKTQYSTHPLLHIYHHGAKYISYNISAS